MNFLPGLHGPFLKWNLQTKMPFPDNRKSAMQHIIMRAKLTILILTITALHVWAESSAQEISIDVKQAPITTVFTQIEKQSGYSFFYDEAYLSGTKGLTLNFKGLSLKEALDKCLAGLPLQYEIVEKNIVIKPKKIENTGSQQQKAKPITGRVTDEKGQPLPGVNVTVKGTTRSVVTDEKGGYSIEANENDIVAFSYLGYQIKEMKISNQAEVNVQLTEIIGQLNTVSVVNTGYQTIPKERATGSFVQIDNELLNRRISTNILERLEGVTNGLSFNRNYLAAEPNASPISIRGISTIYSNKKPLIIVDNFPFDGNIENLNPNDVENVTILKDAAAASIWGARAGNGVIVITTKNGMLGKKLDIKVNTNVSFIEKPDIYYGKNFIDATSFIDSERFLFANGYYNSMLTNTTTRPLLSPVVEILNQQRNGTITQTQADSQIGSLGGIDFRDDQSEYLYKNAQTQQYSINLSGGSDNASYYFSAGYDNVPSSFVGNQMDRRSLYSNLNFQPLKKLEISAGINYSNTKSQLNSLGSEFPFPAAGKSAYYPYARLIDQNGNPAVLGKDYRSTFISGLGSSGLLDWNFRPLEELTFADNATRIDYAKISANVKYKFIEGLNLDIRYQLEKQNGLVRNEQSQKTYFTRNLINLNSSISGSSVTRPIPLGSILDQKRNELTGNSIRAQLNFNRNISNAHEINFMGGIDGKELIEEENRWRAYGFNPEIGTTVPVDYNSLFSKYANLTNPARIPFNDRIDKLTDEYFSYFANASYSLYQKYTLSASGRIDQSNIFGVKANQKNVPLWSVGAAWNINKESFYKVDWLPYLKLRSTYGVSGNIDKLTSAFTTGLFVSPNAITGLPYVVIQNPPNPDLTWERIGMFNAGIDFALKNNMITGSIEYYRKYGSQIMGFAPGAPMSGVQRFNGNVADIKGGGVDIELAFRAGDRLKWNSTLLLSKNTDEVISYKMETTVSGYLQTSDGVSGTAGITPVIGRPIYSVFSYPWAGLNPLNGDPRGFLKGQPSNDYGSIGSSGDINEAIFHGSARPTTFGSFRNSLSFRQFTLSLNITYKLGYFFRKPALSYSRLAANWEGTADYAKRWQKPGDETSTNIPSFTYPLNAARDRFFQFSEVNVERGDHVRLQDVQFSYAIGTSKRKFPFMSLELYGYANNLGILWKQTDADIDPDYVNSLFVQPRSIAIGIRSRF
jgi:TonB-linked SusC/RagA family outer membrane protein